MFHGRLRTANPRKEEIFTMKEPEVWKMKRPFPQPFLQSQSLLKGTGQGPWVIPGDSKTGRLVALLSGEIKTKKRP